MDQADIPDITHQSHVFTDGLLLDCGVHLASLTVAYRSYGTLNAERSNAVLICHALTGDQYVAERHPVTGKGPWWDQLVGSGRPIDTDRYFVICSNVLGGCMGTTGPMEPRAPGEAPWGTDFPPITIRDMVRAQKRLIDRLAIDRLWQTGLRGFCFSRMRKTALPVAMKTVPVPGLFGQRTGCGRRCWFRRLFEMNWGRSSELGTDCRQEHRHQFQKSS